MLQRIARRSLKSHHVLVDAGLRNDVLLEEIVVAKAASQVVVVPGNFALDPRLFRRTEPQTVPLPLLTGLPQCNRRTRPILCNQSIYVSARRNVAIEKSQRPAFPGFEGEFPFQQQSSLWPGLPQVAIQVALQSCRMVRAARPKEPFAVAPHSARRSIQRYQERWRRIEVIKIGVFRSLWVRRSEKHIRTLLQTSDHTLKPLLLGRIASEKLLGFHQTRIASHTAEVMRKARPKVPPHLMHAVSGE